MRVRGTVISIHQRGATVRLENGSLAAVPAVDLAAHRSMYAASLAARIPLDLVLDPGGRHPVVTVAGAPASSTPVAAPTLVDPAFEARMDAYLKQTEAWAPADLPPPAERHFLRKKRRAAAFEARNERA
jgi:hypothetical protein